MSTIRLLEEWNIRGLDILTVFLIGILEAASTSLHHWDPQHTNFLLGSKNYYGFHFLLTPKMLIFEDICKCVKW